jgi:hypothetical protein
MKSHSSLTPQQQKLRRLTPENSARDWRVGGSLPLIQSARSLHSSLWVLPLTPGRSPTLWWSESSSLRLQSWIIGHNSARKQRQGWNPNFLCSGPLSLASCLTLTPDRTWTPSLPLLNHCSFYQTPNLSQRCRSQELPTWSPWKGPFCTQQGQNSVAFHLFWSLRSVINCLSQFRSCTLWLSPSLLFWSLMPELGNCSHNHSVWAIQC